ncbi:DJ-1/PfpI family protein [Deinococcus oregonensis]|uniref:DJ-1/PfpI family protein n=1 Tax=Deinococcus oregonensis TaxID=1805970 RepID=A0ABV6B1Z9_9DEIO
MKLIPKIALSLLAFMAVSAAVGVMNLSAAQGDLLSSAPRHDVTPKRQPLDPAKPTVAVVLGADVTESTDVLGPYAVFAASERFNVVTVSTTTRPVALTGGLDVVPDYTLTELDHRLPSGSAVIVIPNMPHIRAPQNQPIVPWLQRHARSKALLLSICYGADTLALTGLRDGQAATSHWGDLGRLKRLHPQVNWVTGQRYVDRGPLFGSAGILSGIDAALHVVARLSEQAVALNTAQTLQYPATRFLTSPRMPALQTQWSDGITLLNAAFLRDRRTVQVPLQAGVDELALAAVFDTQPAVYAARLRTSSDGAQVVTSRFGLRLVPALTPSPAPCRGRRCPVKPSHSKKLCGTWRVTSTCPRRASQRGAWSTAPVRTTGLARAGGAPW